jgi:hypothetical protein
MGIARMNNGEFLAPTGTSSQRPSPTAGLSQETLRVSAEWLAGQAE